MAPQTQKRIPDLAAMGTLKTLPICKHKSLNIDMEDVAINTHQNMWNDTVNIRSSTISLSISHLFISVALKEK